MSSVYCKACFAKGCGYITLLHVRLSKSPVLEFTSLGENSKTADLFMYETCSYDVYILVVDTTRVCGRVIRLDPEGAPEIVGRGPSWLSYSATDTHLDRSEKSCIFDKAPKR